MDNLAKRYATFTQGTRSGAASTVLARAHQRWLDASMPSYAIFGTVEADIRSDPSVEAILGRKRPWKHHITHDRQMIAFYSRPLTCVPVGKRHTRNSKVHRKLRRLVGERWQSGAGDCRDVKLFSRPNNASNPKVALPVGSDGSTETTYPDYSCRSQGSSPRQFAKRTFQDTESEMRAQKARQAKTRQDKASIVRFHTNKRGRQFAVFGSPRSSYSYSIKFVVDDRSSTSK